MLKKLPVVGVMGSGKEGWSDYCSPLGAALAKLRVHLLTGGGEGVMRCISQSFAQTHPRDGLVLGCIPTEGDDYKPKTGYPNPFVECAIVSPLGTFAGIDPEQVSRNHINILTSDVIIALPGNKGTRNEIDLAMRFKKPICLLGPHDLPDGYAHLPRFQKVEETIEWVRQHLPKDNSSHAA